MITGLPLIMGITTISLAGLSLFSSTAYLIVSNIVTYYYEGSTHAPDIILRWERGLYAVMRGLFTCAIVWFVITSLIVAIIV